MGKNPVKVSTEEVFITEVGRLWDEVRARDDLIFENVEIALNPEENFQKLKENNRTKYMQFVTESSMYEKKRQIRAYFWDEIVGTLYENTLDIMKKAGLLEETLKSFDKTFKIENTARLIIENGIFWDLPTQKKKELTEATIGINFYPASYRANNKTLMESELFYLEENTWDTMMRWTGNLVRGTAYQLKNFTILISYLLISPATMIAAVPTKLADDTKMALTGRESNTRGLNPSMRKFYELIDSLSPVNMIFRFLREDLHDIGKYLSKVNNLEDDYIQDILKETEANSNNMVQKCWNKNKHQMSSSDPKEVTVMDKLLHMVNGAGLANSLRSPLFRDADQIALLLRSDAGNPTYQKMFFEFRICVYEKLFEIILGYAKTIYSMDDASYEVIKHANDAHKNKNFKAFFNLRPKQANEEAMFKIMKALVSIDSIAHTLENRKRELVADKYIDRFSDFLRQNVKQVYQELDELANQRKYNLDRYEEEKPDDETIANKISEDRFNAKKSIFSQED